MGLRLLGRAVRLLVRSSGFGVGVFEKVVFACWVGMFPLILRVPNRDYGRLDYNSY